MKRGSADAASGSRGSKLGRILEAPLRALCWARDLYVRGMTGVASRRGVAGYPAGDHHFHGLPRASSSSSSSSGEDDLRELVRAASQGAVGGRAVGGSGAVVPRSQSVGMARIDEDRPCNFGRDAAVVVPACPRSRSYDLPKRRVGVMMP